MAEKGKIKWVFGVVESRWLEKRKLGLKDMAQLEAMDRMSQHIPVGPSVGPNPIK